MGHHEYFENKRDHRGYDHQYDIQDVHVNSFDKHRYSSEHGGHFNWLNYLRNIQKNKRLKQLVILAFVVILAVVIILIILLFPLIKELFNYITQNGLQGLIDKATGFVSKLWKGSGG